MASPSESADANPIPVRAFWAFVVGSAAMGAIEMVLQAGRIGWDVVSFGLGLFAAALPGVLLGILMVLVLSLARRRFGWRPPVASPRLVAGASVVAVATLVIMLGGWTIARIATDVVQGNPLRFRAAELPLIRDSVFVGVLPAVAVVYAAMRLGEEWLARRKWVGWLGKSAALALLTTGCLQLFSNQLVYYYTDATPPLLVLAWAAVAAWWLPRELAPTRRARVGSLAGGIAVVLLGVLGLNHVGARGLLFHDPRTFPRAFSTYLAMFDPDGDQDFPVWLGGGDCDSFDALASSWRVEIPGNGRDDNCRLGDRAPIPVEAPAASPDGPRPPIFLVTIDTVGADHLDLYGYERATMPALTALAQSARWYRRAYSPSNQTYYSTVAMLSGQSPEKMMRPEDGEDPGALRFTFWLPHRLARLGYETVAFAPPLYDLQKMTLEELRFAEIDEVERDFAEMGRGTTSRAVVDAVIERVRADPGERPLFAWIHLIDPHAVHEAPMVFPTKSPADVWDSELAYVDAQLARLFSALQDRYGRDVIIVVVSDHGEMFGERGFFGHAYSVFDALIKVPLVIYAPSLEPAQVREPVSVLGIVPTVLALLGQPHDPRLSSPPLTGEVDPGPVLAYAPQYGRHEKRMEVALVAGDYKLIRNRVGSTSVMFDIVNDPNETRNLAAVEPQRREELETLMFELLENEP